jgi:hypothetical protein
LEKIKRSSIGISNTLTLSDFSGTAISANPHYQKNWLDRHAGL